MDNCTQISPVKTDVDIVFSVLVNIANVVGVLYNLPQMYHTYKRKTTNDISPIFLHARFWCSIMWIIYCLYYKFWYVFVSWIITGSSSTFMLYYMHIYPRINKKAQFLPVSTNDSEEDRDKEKDDEILLENNYKP